jgi:hypothetical protein
VFNFGSGDLYLTAGKKSPSRQKTFETGLEKIEKEGIFFVAFFQDEIA